MREQTRRLVLAVWFLGAYLAHTVGGMWMGLYDQFWWWHLLTHVLSAGALVGFVQWVTIERFGLGQTMATVFVLALAWETFELFYPGLIFHGTVDLATDLCTDTLGALVGYHAYDRLGSEPAVRSAGDLSGEPSSG